MSTAYRVFGLSRAEPPPAALTEHFRSICPELFVHFTGDHLGWMRAELEVARNSAPLAIERFLVEESDMRHELNSWVAWLETVDHPRRESTIDHVVNSQQVFTLELAHELSSQQQMRELAKAACQYLAQATEGIYQVDDQGFFSADGLLLVPESRIV